MFIFILAYIIIVIKYICDNKYMPERMPKCILYVHVHMCVHVCVCAQASTFSVYD